ncbi:hypothetical protein B0H34DRAFT_290821 [Crassisporium funariophilum]|nr:hypothetical protein B0H34DRAFT_290821 [Crassisporium funariophilum]
MTSTNYPYPYAAYNRESCVTAVTDAYYPPMPLYVPSQLHQNYDAFFETLSYEKAGAQPKPESNLASTRRVEVEKDVMALPRKAPSRRNVVYAPPPYPPPQDDPHQPWVQPAHQPQPLPQHSLNNHIAGPGFEMQQPHSQILPWPMSKPQPRPLAPFDGYSLEHTVSSHSASSHRQPSIDISLSPLQLHARSKPYQRAPPDGGFIAQSAYRSPLPNIHQLSATNCDNGLYDPAIFFPHDTDPDQVAFNTHNRDRKPRKPSRPSFGEDLLGLYPEIRDKQGRYAHSDTKTKWEPKKATTKKVKLRPVGAQRRMSLKGSNRIWCGLHAGGIHTLTPTSLFMPSIGADPELDELQIAATKQDVVVYVPRGHEFAKNYTDSISFGVDGMPGPYILDLAEERVVVDGEDDKVFERFGWKMTKLQIEWPGIALTPDRFYIVDNGGHRMRRGELGTFVATRVAKLIINTQRGHTLPSGQAQKMTSTSKNWDLKKVDYKRLRLIAVNYYEKFWVPVLALDIAAYDE